MKTLQDAANKIARHLFKQKARSHDGNSCRYRIVSDSGRLVNRCAIGCLIEKRHYDRELEGSCPFLENEVNNALQDSGWDVSDSATDFYGRAQRIHDGSWETRNEDFEQLCAEYDLKYNPS